MGIWNYIFSFRGRIVRTDFWLLMLVAVALWAAIVIAALVPIPVVTALVSCALLVTGFVVWLSAATRRMHDRDKSAWYLLLFVGLPTAILSFQNGDLVVPLIIYFSTHGSFTDLACTAIYAWMIVELGSLPGTAGPNRYGPAPSSAPETHSA